MISRRQKMASWAALLVCEFLERQQARGKHAWTAVLGTLVVGVSNGLPLFLFLCGLSKRGGPRRVGRPG